MGTISENFSYREFEKSDTAKRYSLLNSIIDTEVRDAIKALVVMVLQPLRSALDLPCTINSGYRSNAVNTLVGGVESSQHRTGEAADISFDLSPYDVACKVIELNLPFDQMILYPTFVHISHKLNGKQRGEILYSEHYRGQRL